MDAGVTIISSPTVTVRLTSAFTAFETQRRFNRDISIAEFKEKLFVGIPPSHMDLELFSTSDKFLQKLDENEALLGSYPIDSDCRIHVQVIDRSGSQQVEFSDWCKVEKLEMSDYAYNKRSDSVRSLRKKQRLEEEMAKKEAERAAREPEEKAAAASPQRQGEARV